MKPTKDRDQRINRIMWEQYVTREQAERAADKEIHLEEMLGRVMLAVVQSRRVFA